MIPNKVRSLIYQAGSIRGNKQERVRLYKIGARVNQFTPYRLIRLIKTCLHNKLLGVRWVVTFQIRGETNGERNCSNNRGVIGDWIGVR